VPCVEKFQLFLDAPLPLNSEIQKCVELLDIRIPPLDVFVDGIAFL
jgi:hypothetical protein